MALELRKLSHALGAEVVGFRIRGDLPETTVRELRDAFLRYHVLVFRDQEISHETHIAFSRYFGELDPHDSVPDYRLPDHPEILEVTNEGKEPAKVFGRQWHSDHSMTIKPVSASLLRAHQLPDVGGDTMFANMHLAYDTLSDGMKEMLQRLSAVHTVAAARHLQGVDPEVRAMKERINPPVAHPVIRPHSETGRPALYVNEMLTSHFVGMTYEESRPLLEYLFRHSTRPEFVYRHVWRKHDLVMWDNRSTMHIALADYDHSQVRRLYRTTLVGQASGTFVRH
jgi:taurine dioxygenase